MTSTEKTLPLSSSEGDGMSKLSQSLPNEKANKSVVEPAGVVYRSMSHVSGPDVLESSSPQEQRQSSSPYIEAGEEVYDRVSSSRKHVIVTVLSFCAFLAPLSSTSILAAVPEVAKTYHTTGSIINVSNAAYMALMGVSPVVWGPMSQVFGRRPVSLAHPCCLLLTVRMLNITDDTVNHSVVLPAEHSNCSCSESGILLHIQSSLGI